MTFTKSDRLGSSDPFVEGPTPARYWGDQWLRVCEKLLKGLNHQLTNRVASLDSALSLMKVGRSDEVTVANALAGELEQLRELLHLYRSLQAEPLESSEAIRLQDIVPHIVRLHEHHYDLSSYECAVAGEAGTEPVVVKPSALQRCLLVLLASVAGNVRRSRGPGVVSVEYGATGGEVYIRVWGVAPSGQLLFSGEGSLLHAVRAALAHAQGTAEGVIRRSNLGDEIEYELRLPTLATARSQD